MFVEAGPIERVSPTQCAYFSYGEAGVGCNSGILESTSLT